VSYGAEEVARSSWLAGKSRLDLLPFDVVTGIAQSFPSLYGLACRNYHSPQAFAQFHCWQLKGLRKLEISPTRPYVVVRVLNGESPSHLQLAQNMWDLPPPSR